jgi:hypothetical protein
MRILIVNAHRGSSASQSRFSSFVRVLRSVVEEAGASMREADAQEIIVRGLDRLAEFGFGMRTAKRVRMDLAASFDKLDLICVCGDCTLMPWQPQCKDLVALLHTAALTRKPVFATGSGAAAFVYAVCTDGAPLCVQNEDGQSLASLRRFELCGPSQGHPVWHEHGTGDLYEYCAPPRAWRSIGNVGLYKAPCSSKCSREGHPLHEQQRAHAGLFAVRVRKAHLQHTALSLLLSQVFVARLASRTWRINSEHTLPKSLTVLADTEFGPAVLWSANAVLCAFDVDEACPSTALILKAYVQWLRRELVSKGAISVLCAELMSGSSAIVGADKPAMCKPTAARWVESAVRPRETAHASQVEQEPIESVAVVQGRKRITIPLQLRTGTASAGSRLRDILLKAGLHVDAPVADARHAQGRHGQKSAAPVEAAQEGAEGAVWRTADEAGCHGARGDAPLSVEAQQADWAAWNDPPAVAKCDALLEASFLPRRHPRVPETPGRAVRLLPESRRPFNTYRKVVGLAQATLHKTRKGAVEATYTTPVLPREEQERKEHLKRKQRFLDPARKGFRCTAAQRPAHASLTVCAHVQVYLREGLRGAASEAGRGGPAWAVRGTSCHADRQEGLREGEGRGAGEGRGVDRYWRQDAGARRDCSHGVGGSPFSQPLSSRKHTAC